MRRKETPIEKSVRERERKEREQCERAILNRLYTAPATIDELDASGFPKPLVNSVVNDLLHQGRITHQGFTYFYKHLQTFLQENLNHLSSGR